MWEIWGVCVKDWGTCGESVSAYGKVGVLSGRVRGVCWRRGVDVGGLEVFVGGEELMWGDWRCLLEEWSVVRESL